MNINEYMATEVMGWHIEVLPIVDDNSLTAECWVQEDGEGVIIVNGWHPDTDIAQALMCADKFGMWRIAKNQYTGEISFTLWEGGGVYIEYANTLDELPLAICEAIREAVER